MKFLIPLCFLAVVAGCDSSSNTVVSDNPVSLAVSDSLVADDNGTTARAVCTSDAVDSGGGWGFENGVSCIWPGAVETSAAVTTRPECCLLYTSPSPRDRG